MEKGGYTYILSNKNNTALYIGVSSKLKQRIFEHKNKKYKNSFTFKYKCDKLVYYEGFDNIVEAIYREKQLKAGSRAKKIELITCFNPTWDDLFERIEND